MIQAVKICVRMPARQSPLAEYKRKKGGSRTGRQPGTAAEQMKIGIIGAMSEEVALLKEHMQISGIVSLAKMDFFEGTIGNTSVIVVQSGIGKVNAAICAQLLITRFGATHVINTGIAGSLDSRMDVLDILVSIDAVYHDVDATVFGYHAGEVPGLGLLAFPADPFLREMAVTSARKAAPESHVYEGRVASGDQFISTTGQKNTAQAVAGGNCCEMEGAAIAHACWLNGIPYVILRLISDKPGQTTNMEYQEIEAAAARRSAEITLRMLKDLRQ